MFKTKLAYETWKSKYRYGDETPIETFQRVAKALASVEKNPEAWYNRFLNTLIRCDLNGELMGLKCTTGGRITANIGTSFKKATLVNCFISGPVTGATVEYTRKTDNGLIQYPVKYKTDESPDDLVNIFLTIMEQAKTLASEGGYGVNFDFIRPRGSLIKGTGIKHPGVVAYMKIWDAVSECIVQGDTDGYVDKIKNHLKSEEKFQELKATVKKSIRKGAMLAALSVSHPDAEEFIRAKQTSGVLTKFNISIVLDDAFMKAVENDDYYDQVFNGTVYKRVKAREMYDLIMRSTYNRAEPGVLFSDNMMKNNPIAYMGSLSCVNPCVVPETLILTDRGHYQIGSLENQWVNIWNGFEFSNVRIRKTGENQGVLKIRFSNSVTLECTPYHEFYIQRGFSQRGSIVKIQAKDLKVGDRLAKYELPVITGGDKIFPEAYTHGFFCADGCYKYQNEVLPKLYLYGKKKELVEHIAIKSGSGIPDSSDRLSFYLDDELLPKFEVPLNDYRIQDRLNWFSGYADGDGSINTDDTGNQSLQVSSINLDFLLKVRLMLQTLGIDSKVSLSHKEGLRNLPDGKGGLKEYLTQDCYRLLVSSNGLLALHKMGWRTHRLCYTYKEPNRDASQFIKVSSVEDCGRISDTYCFSDPKRHSGMFNGIMTGQCGEIPGLSSITTVCLLGSPNLTQYVKINVEGEPYFDFEEYAEDVRVFLRMLDNVNDLTYSPLPSYQWVIENLRQVGMGINGLGSTLAMLKIPYNSKQAVNFTEKISKMKENLTWQTSALLAKEKGVFTAYNKELFESTEYFKSDRITEETKDYIRRYGVRNAKTTTCPPLGNSSIISDVTSNGVEPIFLLEYERKVICREWPEGLSVDNVRDVLKYHKEKDYEYWRGEYKGTNYYYEPHNRGLCEISVVRDYGYQWLLDNYPGEDYTPYLKTSRDIAIDDHLAIQEMVQYYNNQSVSKTCTLPNKFHFDDFKDLYIKAWKSGLNGFTTYREGSMESVLSDINKADKRDIIVKDIKLPDVFINGSTQIIKKEGKKFYLHFSYLPDDSKHEFPIVLWIYTNAKYKADELRVCNKAARNLATLALKCGVEQRIVKETVEKANEDYPHNRLGRMISLCLRHNILREDILVSLMNIDGDHISTLLTAVRKFLSKTLADGTKLKDMKCPECGDTVIMIAGCQQCPSCPWSLCG